MSRARKNNPRGDLGARGLHVIPGKETLLLVPLASSVDEKMPARCQVAECDNNPDKIKGISLHPIPFLNDERHEAK